MAPIMPPKNMAVKAGDLWPELGGLTRYLLAPIIQSGWASAQRHHRRKGH